MEEQMKAKAPPQPIPTKPMMSSKTIRIGTFYITAGALVGILQLFDLLEVILASIQIEGVSPATAAWLGMGLAILGAIQVWLRMVTTQPVGKGNALAKIEKANNSPHR